MYELFDSDVINSIYQNLYVIFDSLNPQHNNTIE